MKTRIFAAALMALAVPAAAAPHGIKIGVLNCNVESGWGYVLGSSKDMTCTYHPNHGEDDRYVGSISKFGIDIGYTSGATLVWDVIAPTSDMRSGALAGDYAGATASATIAAGLGAHVLLGGFDKSIALQPVSFESSSGLDIAAGIGEMSLRAAPPPPAVVSQAAPPVETVRDVEYVVSFNFDEARLTRDSRRVIRQAAAEAAREHPDGIVVVGHADLVGGEDYNDALSQRRADAVKDELARQGIDPHLINVDARGFHDPAVPEERGQRQRDNRRVVIRWRDTTPQHEASR